MNTLVQINDHIVARHPYVYTSFHCDLTRYLKYDSENLIRVTVNNNAAPNSRWYSGSGIYRHVWLMVADKIHIAPWGVYATTPKVSAQSSAVSIKTLIENNVKTTADITVRSALFTHCGDQVTFCESEINIHSDGKTEAAQTLKVSQSNL